MSCSTIEALPAAESQERTYDLQKRLGSMVINTAEVVYRLDGTSYQWVVRSPTNVQRMEGVRTLHLRALGDGGMNLPDNARDAGDQPVV